MKNFIYITINSLDFFSKLVLILQSESHSSYDDGSVAVWRIPYLIDFSDLRVTYDFKNHTLEIMETEVDSLVSSLKIDSQVLHKLIGVGKLHEANVLFNDKEI